MMLLALTRRPFRLTQTLALNWPATCVSLAEARACSPSLLMISTSRCSIINDEGGSWDPHHAVAPAAHGLGDDRLERLVTVSQDPDQHRQIDARHTFDLARDQQLGGDIGGRAAIHVGENQHSLAFIELLHELARLRQQAVRIILRRDAELFQAQRALVEHVARAVDQALAECAVGNDQDADHERGLSPRRLKTILYSKALRRTVPGHLRPEASSRSSASMNMAATLKPLCSVISWKQVGLVTLTSVNQSPMTSRPTRSRPSLCSAGPSASAISRSRRVSSRATPVAPAARLPRVSPGLGIRASAWGTGLPPMSRTRLSPSRISGTKRWAMMVRPPRSVTVSMMTLRLGSFSRTRKTDAPPIPSSGLRITSRCSAMNSRTCASRRVTMVGGAN